MGFEFKSKGWGPRVLRVLTLSLPPAVGGYGGEGDVEADGNERRRACDGDDLALPPPGLHGGPLGVLESSREGAGGEEKRGEEFFLRRSGLGGEGDEQTVAATEPASGGHEDVRDLAAGFRVDGWIWRGLLTAFLCSAFTS